MTEAPHSTKRIIRPSSPLVLTGVSLTYDSRTILEAIDAEFQAGSRTIIVGENGAGKTSLLKIALGLIEPSAGTVNLFGERPGARSMLSSRRRAGYVHQESVDVDFPICAYEVVSIGVAASRESRRVRSRIIDEAMARTGCGGIADRPFRVLSGGEKQRVSIARCLCQKPSLLVLDEPFASLDPDACRGILDLLENFQSDITIVMVSHQLADLGFVSSSGSDGGVGPNNDEVAQRWRILRLEGGKLR